METNDFLGFDMRDVKAVVEDAKNRITIDEPAKISMCKLCGSDTGVTTPNVSGKICETCYMSVIAAYGDVNDDLVHRYFMRYKMNSKDETC